MCNIGLSSGWKTIWIVIVISRLHDLTIYLIVTPLNTFAEQTQIRQLMLELSDQGLLCLLMEIWLIWSYANGPDK